VNEPVKAARGARSAAAAMTLLQAACERLPVGFALFDAGFRLVASNARFAALRGYPRKLVKTGTPLESFVRFDAERGEYGAGAIDALTRTKVAALKRGRPAEREQALPDGRFLRIACERLPEGGLLLTCEDVTAARRTAQRLRESDERYALAMHAINEGVYDWDIANDTVHYSKRVWHAVGLSPEKLETPGDYFARIHPDDQPRFLAASAAHFKGETERFELDYRYRASDGTWRWGRQHGVALRDARGRAYRMVGSVGDITELKERERQLAEQTTEQTAVRELLEAISRSAFGLDAVLRTLIESATRLCRAEKGFIFRLEGDVYRLAVDHGGVTPEFREFIAQHPIRAGRDTLVGRTALEKRTVHIEDVLADREYRGPQSQRIGAYRTMLGVPIVRDGTLIGVIALWKERVEPFTPAQIALVTTFSNQAVIAIENARLFNETKEALEQQTATAEILRVISESPGDLAPVFRAILERATGLCDAQLGIVFRWDGERYHIVATRGEDADAIARWKEAFATVGRPGPHSGLGRLLVDKQPVHIPDILEEAAYREGDALRLQTANILKARSFLAVPLLKNDAVIGAIVIYRHEVRPFGARQVELVRVFADQAVIAIENVRLFNETKEALEQQTATAEILKVISSSPTDVQPVFDAIVKSGVHLFQGVAVSLRLVKGDRIERAAFAAGPDCEVTEDLEKPSFPLDDRTSAGRAVLRREVIHVPDVFAEDWFAEEGRKHAERMGWRSVIAAPMLREGKPLGAILVVRAQPAPFSEKEIALLRTFADQAVIAIENVRLFNETKEALEKQTAISEILRVISASPTDVQPVFDTIVRSAVTLCGSTVGAVFRYDGELLHYAAGHELTPQGLEAVRSKYPLRPDPSTLSGRVISTMSVAHIDDVLADPQYDHAYALHGGWRRLLAVPMLREGIPLGVMLVAWTQPGATPKSQEDLLKTFAEQAVIAIENVRLFNELEARNRELTESLEQQTATAEILRVISSSPTDITPVLDAVAENAARLCDAHDVVILMNEGDVLRSVKSSGPFGERFGTDFTIPITRGSAAGRAVVDRATVHVANFALEPEEEYPVGRAHQRIYGNHGAMATPLLRGDAALGVIAVLRRDVRPFSDRQSALLQTFADQAVIAIENVRLFNETKEALDQQKASAEVLEVISSSVADTKPVFDKILESCERLFVGQHVGINLIGEDGAVHLGPYRGPGRPELERIFPLPLSRESASGSAILERRVMHYPDIEGGADVPEPVRRAGRSLGFKSAIFAPMLWEGRAIGTIFVNRDFVGPFSDKEIALLKTFADQAVIAIQNARLFNEIREKGHQLEIANQHKSAFVANMSHELRTPLNAVIGFSEMLAARYFGNLTDKQAEYVNDIRASGKHLLSLINDILDLSKLEAGRMELEVGEFDLRAALDNALTLVRERAQRGGVALQLETDPTLGAFRGDERKLKQVVLNLLSNAVKFTPRGGAVGVVARQANGSAEIAVSDTGAGIAPQDQEAIFEAFRQVGTDVTRKREGTGLGLALTRRFVELHGGTISVESTPGKGSTFTVTLPIRHGE